MEAELWKSPIDSTIAKKYTYAMLNIEINFNLESRMQELFSVFYIEHAEQKDRNLFN